MPFLPHSHPLSFPFRLPGRLFLFVFLLFLSDVRGDGKRREVEVASLAELIEAATKSGQTVTMRPGKYRLIDAVPLESVAGRNKRKDFQMITFSGSDNHFFLDGVEIEWDTRIRQQLRQPVHTDEMVITGKNNTIEGLRIETVGEGTSPCGALLGIFGEGTTLKSCAFEIAGSSPYGYGDLFGKGGHKHSGVHIEASRTTVLDCSLVMKSFGHGFYIQKDADNVRFERCTVEGRMRSTDEILKETSGLAVKKEFEMVMRGRDGSHRIVPGYRKALSEDAFRTYGKHENLVFIDCTARRMRGGFELRTPTGPVLRGCRVEGCERGFWVSSGAKLTDCGGDASVGPLFYLEGDNATVDLTLKAGSETGVKVHAAGAIYGSNNELTLRTEKDHRSFANLPVLLGWGPPGMGENMSPFSDKDVKGAVIHNATSCPVKISPRARDCRIRTAGPVLENKGTGITIEPITKRDDNR